MLLATWRLWTPQAIFPRVPLLQAAAALPAALDWLLFGLAVAGLAVALFSSSARIWPAALRSFAGAGLGLILLDQHRLQPWAWQAVLVALALANCPPPRALALVRLLTLSIYLYSGWSKLDYEFLHTLGQQFIAVPLRIVGANPGDWPDAWRLAAAGMLPLAEIALAGAFCFRRLWTAALAGSIVLHGLLLVALGPWGLNHSAAVLLWNAYFIVQNLLLFSGGATESARAAGAAVEPDSGRLANRATQALLVAAMLLPILEPWGLWDAWPSWSLYAPNCERTTVLVQRSAAGALGPLEAFVESVPRTSLGRGCASIAGRSPCSELRSIRKIVFSSAWPKPWRPAPVGPGGCGPSSWAAPIDSPASAHTATASACRRSPAPRIRFISMPGQISGSNWLRPTPRPAPIPDDRIRRACGLKHPAMLGA